MRIINRLYKKSANLVLNTQLMAMHVAIRLHRDPTAKEWLSQLAEIVDHPIARGAFDKWLDNGPVSNHMDVCAQTLQLFGVYMDKYPTAEDKAMKQAVGAVSVAIID
jgi:hypothetical protein